MWRPTPQGDAEVMPNPSRLQPPAANDAPVPDETTLTGLTVDGTLPAALSGRFLRIGPNPIAPTPTGAGEDDGMVHAVDLRAGRAVRYCNRWVTTDRVARALGTEPVPGPPAALADTVATNVLSFGGRTLALGPGALAYELDEHLATVRRVDLAGRGRGVGAHPVVEPVSGELHLVSHGDEPAHHVLAPSGLTRSTHPVPHAPGPLRDLLLTPDHLVLLGDGFAGVADRARSTAIRWCDADLAGAVAAHDTGDGVVVLAAAGSLIRWTLAAGSARREVLDDTSQRFGVSHPRHGTTPRRLWTVAAEGGTEVHRHDIGNGNSERTSHDHGVGRRPGAVVFVPDPARRHRDDGGWLVGFVHDDRRLETDLVVLDAADMGGAPVATVRIPRRIPSGLHATWIPAP